VDTTTHGPSRAVTESLSVAVSSGGGKTILHQGEGVSPSTQR
jgi:hypothetical protein